MKATKLTTEQYVSIIEAGGTAYSFHPDYCGHTKMSEEDTAYVCLVTDRNCDVVPDVEPYFVYYTLTE